MTNIPNKSDGTRKTYVLDTSVLMHDPNCLNVFEDNNVVIPIVAIEELDGLKKGPKGNDARAVFRQLDKFRTFGNLQHGVATEQGGTIRIDLDGDNGNVLPNALDPTKPDNSIIITALRLQKSNPSVPVVLVTKDMAMRVKADSLGLAVEDYRFDKVDSSAASMTGFVELEVEDEIIGLIYRERIKASNVLSPEVLVAFSRNNTCCRIVGRTTRNTALAIYRSRDGYFKLVEKSERAKDKSSAGRTREKGKKEIGIGPRNEMQDFACALMEMPDIELVAVVGKAGTGKSLMALLCAWTQVIGKGGKSFPTKVIEPDADHRVPEKIIVFRPTRELGAELGFLPGSLAEKIAPWQVPTFGSLARIEEGFGGGSVVSGLVAQGKIEILPINHIRGGSLPWTIMVIDDAQNFTPGEIKAITTRADEGTKVFITGDLNQVDVPFLDAQSNGLAHLIYRFRTSEDQGDRDAFGNITLIKGERSSLAERAANIL